MLTGFAAEFRHEASKIFGQEPVKPAFLPETPFTVIFFENQQVAFHLIHLDANAIQAAGTSFFVYYLDNAEEQGVRLVTVWEDVWMLKRSLVIAHLISLAGKSARVFARNTVVKRITKTVADEFLDNYHLGGSPSSRFKYGLFVKKTGELAAAGTFSPPRTFYRNDKPFRSYELIRYAGLSGVNITGGLGKLLSAFTEDVNPDDIMTYADRNWWTGDSYKALGFQCAGTTSPQTFWVKPGEWVRYIPGKVPSLLSNEFEASGLPPEDFMKLSGYIQVFNCGNRKFLLLLR